MRVVSCTFKEAAVGVKLILYAIEQPGKSVKCILHLQNKTKINQLSVFNEARKKKTPRRKKQGRALTGLIDAHLVLGEGPVCGVAQHHNQLRPRTDARHARDHHVAVLG